jgi:hypothetical protein
MPDLGMHKITTKEFTELDLGDIRRNERFTTIVDNIINRPGQSIQQQNENWYNAKATYEFFKNEDITLEKLQQTIHAYGAASIATDLDFVLILHDTSNISYNGLAAEGLGYLDNKLGNGLLLHTSMVASTSGIPLALLYQQVWTRDINELAKGKERQNKSIEEKESYKWLKGIMESNQLLDSATTKVHIADREADIHELFSMERGANTEFLIRAFQNRQIVGGTPLWNEISNLPLNASIVLQIPDVTGHKKAATTVEVRYQKVTLLCPKHKKGKYQNVELTAIEVRQPGMEDEESGIWWKLLTTLEVTDIEDVKLYILWYTYRWLIERFHYVLKSGCKIESLQLKQAESLKKAIVMYSLAAFKIMQMTYQSRETPDVSCEVVLSRNEWEALYIRIHKTGVIPTIVPTLQQAAQWIGRLGGHLGRKSDGPPGLKAIWRGFQRLNDFTDLYMFLKTEKNLGND